MTLVPILTYIIGMYDPYGSGHSNRVASLALRLIERLGIKKDAPEYHDIEYAAYLHDIGKIGVPEYVRRQPGRFLPAERMLMEQHPVIGEKILSMAENGVITPGICQIVRYHHEDWNGTGYPEKLKGEEIPRGARIIRVCDFYDAITNVRGYQNALSENKAIRLMEDEQTIKQWADPEILAEFIRMIRESSNA